MRLSGVEHLPWCFRVGLGEDDGVAAFVAGDDAEFGFMCLDVECHYHAWQGQPRLVYLDSCRDMILYLS